MNMEGNKDEAFKCRRIGEKYLVEGNRNKAEKFLRKAQRLYPNAEVEGLINLVVLSVLRGIYLHWFDN